MTCSCYASAQTVYGASGTRIGKETKEERTRRLIDIDASVPDYKTNKIDQKIMGWRLAKMLDAIQRNYQQATYNRYLSSIRYEQTEDQKIRFTNIDKLSFVSAEKVDSVILIKMHTYTKLDSKEKINCDITFRFINGISDSEHVNSLFSDISRYIKPDEE